MNARLLGVVALSLGACSGAGVSSQTDHLIASADAQHLGVFSYTVAGDSATMFDKDGIELGQLQITSPVAERRLIRFELATGATDEVEVYRPKTDGTFFAPISPVTATTVAVADPALAPLFLAHQMTFKATDDQRLSPIAPETLATTTQCTGGCDANNDAWSCTTPAGCVRSANTGVGCTNPSQLPATMASDTGANAIIGYGPPPLFHTLSACQTTGNGGDHACNLAVGAGNWSRFTCAGGVGIYQATCWGRKMVSQWVASCPEQTCTTGGDYDAVPRQDQCYDPGSCAFQQGTVTCTSYH